VEAAWRGAAVSAIDVAGGLVDIAQQRAPAFLGHGRIDWHVGDMLDPPATHDGQARFDHIVAMDSLIHYPLEDMAWAVERLAARCNRSLVFTFAPHTACSARCMPWARLSRAPIAPPRSSPSRSRAARAPRLAPGLAAWPQRADHQRVLHFPRPGTGAPLMAASMPLAQRWSRVALTWLPFADAASADVTLPRLLRLSLFQVSVGMMTVLLNGTLNRVLIVELGIHAWLVSLMIAIPLLAAPFRALIGHRSDVHRSVLGWRRVPFIWFGTLMQFGGLAIMPFALLLMRDPHLFPVGLSASALAFLLAGTGMHTTQTAGLALVGDLLPEDRRARAVALLYLALLAGMMVCSTILGGLLNHFTPTRLVQVIQACAVLTFVLNVVALWKQEARSEAIASPQTPRPPFAQWYGSQFAAQPLTMRLLATVGLGAAAFAMQDPLLEPYGGKYCACRWAPPPACRAPGHWARWPALRCRRGGWVAGSMPCALPAMAWCWALPRSCW
jgi:BCD family chlorophyll transporter-like MFS transporter